MYKILILLLIGGLFACQNQPSKETKNIAEEKSNTTEKTHDTLVPKHQQDEMTLILGKPKKNIKTVGILVYDGVNELDLMGPRYILGQIMGAKTQLIALKKGNIRTVMGTEIVPNTTIDSVSQLDILVIPGGFKGTVLATYDTKLHDWIRKIDKNTTYTAAVCTGGWILGATGLLKDKKATSNWYQAEQMMTKYGAKFESKRFVNDGKYWTSAGVTAGMDMSLAMLKDIWGEKYAQAVMLDMEYDPMPPFEGGSPKKTPSDVLSMMNIMYGMGLMPLIDSLEKVKK